jgi:hypothetical protein
MRSRPIDRRRGVALLVLGGILVAIAQVLGLGGPPVYDGLPVPADPYRYLDPPAGVKNPGPPLSAHVNIDLIGGGNSAIDLPTGEFPPQAELQLFHGDVDGIVSGVPAVTTAEVTIRAVPMPSAALPAGRQLHGNVYEMKVVANGHSLQLSSSPQTLVSLRQPRTSAASPQIAVLDGDKWELLDTHPGSGAGVLSARLPRLGDVAIVEKTSGFVKSGGHTGLYAGLGFAAFAVAVIAVIRVLRTRPRPRTRSRRPR